jgi:hypothetical protein
MRCVLGCVVLTLCGVFARPAFACGGCFVPASSSVVVQDAERILFVHDEKLKRSTVWVEIRYNGPGDDFGWVLPLPEQPTVGVGTSYLFDRLDFGTGPRFNPTIDPVQENCGHARGDSGGGCGAMAEDAAVGGVATSFKSAPNEADIDPKTGVKILEHSQVGPYDYVVISGSTGAGVQEWLDARNYGTPKLATEVIDAHVKKGDVFVAVRLKQGATAKEIKPIALTMPTAEPCVPLRLTAIAASEDMTVVAYVAGPGRAVPKNYLHVQLNPVKVDWFNAAANYSQVVAAAIDEAAGHAFVTEYAGKLPEKVEIPQRFGQAIIDPLFDEQKLDASVFASATTAQQVIQKLKSSGFPVATDSAAILDKYVGLSGGKADKLVEVYQNAHGGEVGLDNKKVDGNALAQELDQEFVQPLKAVLPLLRGTDKFTRLVMRISPKEMTKDPVFAFHKSLPDVSNVRKATLKQVCRGGDWTTDAWRLTLDGLGSWVVPITTNPNADNSFPRVPNNANDPRFKAAPAALSVELLDETGDPKPIDKSQIELVDAAIAGAVWGKPSLPDGFALKTAAKRWTPPVSEGVYDTPPKSGCAVETGGGGRWAVVGLVLVAMAVVAGVRRRRA